MNSLAVILRITLLLINGLMAQGPIDVPSRPNGFSRGPINAQIKFEIFLDLTCPDSKDSYNEIKSLLDLYPNSLQLIIHLFPLPYHRNAFITSQTAYLINHRCPNQFYNFIDLAFDQLGSLSDANTVFMNGDQVSDLLVHIANNSGCFYENIKAEIQPGQPFNYKARDGWKYGCSRSVSGTPQVFINGVYFTNRFYSLPEWKIIIDNLLGQNLLLIKNH